MTAILAGPYIDGAWATPSGGRVVDVINPATEEPIAQAQLAGPEDIDRAVRAARAALGAWSAATPDERAAVLARAAELIGERAQEIARTITLEVGSPRPIAEWQPLAARLILEWHAVQAATFPWEQQREGLRSRLARAPAARRRGRRDRALELPVRAVAPEARPRAAHRLHRRAQAAAADPAVRRGGDRGVRGRRPAAGRAQRRARRPRGRRAPRPPPARGQAQLHRQHNGRPPDRRALRRADQALQPRARRQVSGDRASGRRPRFRDRSARAEHDAQQRPGVHERHAGAGPPGAIRRRRRGAARADRRLRGRRSLRSRRRRRSAGQRRPARRASRTASPRACAKARGSSSAAAAARRSSAATTSSPRCSPTSTTA